MSDPLVSQPPLRERERRAEVRELCDMETCCRPHAVQDGQVWLARVRDLSASGVGVLLGRGFAPGTILSLNLPDPVADRPLMSWVRVVHSTPHAAGGWLVGCVLAGELTPEEQAAIRDAESETTWHTGVRTPASASQDVYLVNIYPSGPAIGRRFMLGAQALVLGRDSSSDISIDNHSVSRQHARIERRSDGYYAVDLRSTNGTYINDRPMTVARLHDGDYLRVGNCIFRFLAGSNVEAEYHQELHQLAIIDALTQVPNRRALLESLDRELSRTARYHNPLSLLFLDIDDFKRVNDTLGHLVGDFTLRELASIIQGSLRKDGGMFARYSGDEFILLLVETPREAAVAAAERLRVLVEQHPFQYSDHRYRLTISLGVVSTAGEKPMTPEEFIGEADRKLYQAKHTGRNRVQA